ncbi:MAG: hypothetical protein EBR82_81825 [Caulobacteraceae bacterium]|nr:hypothetical protein [Caulobacteraceae bacterium]
MDPNYRAMPSDWSTMKRRVTQEGSSTAARTLLELRARIEALEAAQQPEQITYEPQWHRLSEREPQDCDRCIYQLCPSVLHEYGIWCSVRNGFWAADTGLFVGDPERISWRLARPHEIPPQPVPDHIADINKMVDTGWRNLHDLSPIMEPAPPAPADGLVKRVADELCRAQLDGPSWEPEARAAIREVAAWLRSDGPDWPSVASLLEQEANR